MVEKTASPETKKYPATDREAAGDREIIVSCGWCGGFGEAVLAPPEFTNIQFFQDLPVFVTDPRIRDYARNAIPIVDSATPVPQRIRVQGRIRLVKKTGCNESIRGAPLQTFWDAGIERLDYIGLWDDQTNEITRLRDER